MRNVLSVEFYPGTREERLPGFTPQFPHIASRSVPDRYPAGGAPWHWHRSLELFYVQQGAVVYHTPHGQQVFRAGMGGMVNSNVLHHTQSRTGQDESVLLLHLFEPELVAAIASAAFCSQRECYRVFQECLHTTPTAYLQNVRLQAACKLLIETDASMTDIAQRCGLGSSSYFGAQFRAALGCTPTSYREKWQDIESTRQK